MSFLKNLIKTYKNVEEENEENIHGEINSEYVNAAEMRATLEYAREVLAINGFVEPVVRCDAALAAPPRNCDVGTAQEQGIRFKRFCDVRTNTWDGCRGCPVNTPGNEHTDCSLIWAQMPYEANEENGGAE